MCGVEPSGSERLDNIFRDDVLLPNLRVVIGVCLCVCVCVLLLEWFHFLSRYIFPAPAPPHHNKIIPAQHFKSKER